MKETCMEIHPDRKICLGFTCCNEMYKKFKSRGYTTEELVSIIDRNTVSSALGIGAFEMYGVKRDNQFEGYGRATESNEIPYHAFIRKNFTGDYDYTSGDCRTLREALEWLAFCLERLNIISTDR